MRSPVGSWCRPRPSCSDRSPPARVAQRVSRSTDADSTDEPSSSLGRSPRALVAESRCPSVSGACDRQWWSTAVLLTPSIDTLGITVLEDVKGPSIESVPTAWPTGTRSPTPSPRSSPMSCPTAPGPQADHTRQQRGRSSSWPSPIPAPATTEIAACVVLGAAGSGTDYVAWVAGYTETVEKRDPAATSLAVLTFVVPATSVLVDRSSRVEAHVPPTREDVGGTRRGRDRRRRAGHRPGTRCGPAVADPVVGPRGRSGAPPAVRLRAGRPVEPARARQDEREHGEVVARELTALERA